MAAMNHRLAFERPIYELEARLVKLEGQGDASPEGAEEVRRVRRELAEAKKRIYSQLQPWETVQVARHDERPRTADYLNLVFDEFVELHGDKSFGDDRALLTGFGKLDQYKVMVVGHQKGRDTKQKLFRNFGMTKLQDRFNWNVSASGRKASSHGNLGT